jgi:hypothetical protein
VSGVKESNSKRQTVTFSIVMCISEMGSRYTVSPGQFTYCVVKYLSCPGYTEYHNSSWFTYKTILQKLSTFYYWDLVRQAQDVNYV